MYFIKRNVLLLLGCLMTAQVNAQTVKSISEDVLYDKILGYWNGQLVGNYLGFPFENLYDLEPIPVFVDHYYNVFDTDSLDLKMNINDRRAYVHILADALGGAWSDDDTDIEFVTLHGLEKFGLE